jgi:hypothetical protein
MSHSQTMDGVDHSRPQSTVLHMIGTAIGPSTPLGKLVVE